MPTTSDTDIGLRGGQPAENDRFRRDETRGLTAITMLTKMAGWRLRRVGPRGHCAFEGDNDAIAKVDGERRPRRTGTGLADNLCDTAHLAGVA